MNPLQKPALTFDLPLVVLDTNVVLDWLLFADASAQPWGAAISAGELVWIATVPMRGELAHVLERGLARARGGDVEALLATWDRTARVLPQAPAAPWRCGDPDDQMFLDLALAHGAAWLVTRDKALLRLGSKAQGRGLRILRPEALTPTTAQRD